MNSDFWRAYLVYCQNVEPNIAQNAVPNIAPNVTPDMALNVMLDVMPNVAQNIAPNASPNVPLKVRPVKETKNKIKTLYLHNALKKTIKMKKIISMAATAAAMTALSCAQTPDLSGEWKVVTINGVEIEAPETEDEVAPFINFDAESGRIHGNTGVNLVNGTYELSGNDLTFGTLATTMMAGPEPKAQTEQEFLAAVNEVKSAKVKAGVLTLYDADGNVLMTLAK